MKIVCNVDVKILTTIQILQIRFTNNKELFTGPQQFFSHFIPV